jgi:hypothetical protein
LQFSLPNTVDVEMIALDKPSFEEFVAKAEKDGKSFDQLILAQVECDDGKTRNLALDWEIWVESILPCCSKRLGSLYFQMNVSGKAQESKLRRIKKRFPICGLASPIGLPTARTPMLLNDSKCYGKTASLPT